MNKYIVIGKAPNEIERLCRVGLKFYLYQCESWMMYKHYNNPGVIDGIGLYYIGHKAVGACIVEHQFENINTYVTHEYRRQGIGTKLIGAMCREFPDHPKRWAAGVYGSSEFYRKTLNER